RDKEGNISMKRTYVNINRMQLLTEVLESVAKKMVVTVNVADLTKEMYESLSQIFEKHKGDKNVLFVLNDMENKTQLKLPAQNAKVSISRELLQEVREIPNLQFMLN